MFKIMLALHLVFAVFAVGPLAHAVTAAIRGVREGDAASVAASARMARVYAYASALVIVFGFALMSSTSPFTHQKVADFSETWIWLSLLLWVVAVVATLAVAVPNLTLAASQIGAGAQIAAATRVRIAASGGATAALFVAIIFLMVYRPG